MPIGDVQLVNSATAEVIDTGWATRNAYFVLVTVEGDDTWTAYSSISASEVSAGGDYDQIDAGTLTENDSGGQRQYIGSVDAIFGPSVTITAKTLVCLIGNEASPQAADPIIFWIDLDTAGGDVSSTSGDFTITRPTSPATGVWFTIGAQA